MSHCRNVPRGGFHLLGHIQMEVGVDSDHLRKNPHSVFHPLLEIKQIVIRAYE